MNYASTRDAGLSSTLSVALRHGLAPDGGLYVPRALPRAPTHALGARASLPALAEALLAPFFAGDRLAPELKAIAAESLDVVAPVVPLQDGTERLAILELFHGPTAAFKDFGARFLAACLARLPEPESPTLTVLVATSGDTGAAVAAAFHGRPGMRVVVLYPEGRVSRIQEQQLTGWDGNVRSFAVQGSFDDCQRLVKQAFADAGLRERFALTSANSINIGRLLPQVVLFASAALATREAAGTPASFVIPSGNLGLATACLYAREMGLPVGRILLAHNANRTVTDFMTGGDWKPRTSVATLASAMDVGDPSNMERLFALYPDAQALRHALRAVSIDDAAIRESIRGEFQRGGVVACPHTAAGLAAYRGLPVRERRELRWVVAATAHPAKFPEIVEPLVGRRVEPPAALARLLDRPSRRERLLPSVDELADRLGEAPCLP
jgi:threonine synthase